MMNPLHVDLTTKYADMLATNEDYSASAAVLERLVRESDSPAFVKQWLGYVLRFIPDRLDDSIRYSQDFHKMFPDESDTFFNVAYAYANKYREEERSAGAPQPQSVNRQKALSTLREALSKQPEMAPIVRTRWTEQGEAFDRLIHDREFREIAGLAPEPLGQDTQDGSAPNSALRG